jgi:D-alanine--poly(phosphoribitol) ligase subunit 2
MSTAEHVMEILATVSGRAEIGQHPDVRLYEQHLLDSLGTVELIVSLSERFGIDISPAELEPEDWATPRKIVAFVEQRVGP